MKKLIILLGVFTTLGVAGQAPRKLMQTPGYTLSLDQLSKIVLPPGYDATKKYPLVIFTSFTGGSAEDFFRRYAMEAHELNHEETSDTPQPSLEAELKAFLQALFGTRMNEKAFIALIPPGEGSTKDHSWQGFEACIYRNENRILKDIETYSKQYSIDASRIVMIGYSLGGDLSWAITQRYPEKFKGALASGTRCGYTEAGMMERQAKKGVRYYLTIGNEDLATRKSGMNNAKALLDKAGVKNKYAETMGTHVRASIEQLRVGFNFILFPQ